MYARKNSGLVVGVVATLRDQTLVTYFNRVLAQYPLGKSTGLVDVLDVEPVIVSDVVLLALVVPDSPFDRSVLVGTT